MVIVLSGLRLSRMINGLGLGLGLWPRLRLTRKVNALGLGSGVWLMVWASA